MVAATKLFCSAIKVKIDAKTGPAHGVQTKPKVIPNKKALKFPLFPRPTFTLTLEIKGVNLTASISNGFEHIKSNPKITRITSSVERSKGTLIAKQGKAEEFRLRKSVGQRHRAHGITDNQRSNQYYPHKGF